MKIKEEEISKVIEIYSKGKRREGIINNSKQAFFAWCDNNNLSADDVLYNIIYIIGKGSLLEDELYTFVLEVAQIVL